MLVRSFKPSDLPKWWAANGHSWVEDFERLNPLMKHEDLVVDPEMMEQINEEFDRCDKSW